MAILDRMIHKIHSQQVTLSRDLDEMFESDIRDLGEECSSASAKALGYNQLDISKGQQEGQCNERGEGKKGRQRADHMNTVRWMELNLSRSLM